MTPPRATRREFLRRSTGLAFAGAAAPWALNLAAMSEAAAQSATDYKALVCVFLYGGNDYGNTLIPYDVSGYANYAALRPDVCIARDALAGTVLQPLNPSSDGRQFALAPQLSPLSALFASGQLGVLMNIGPLMQSTTKAQYLARSVPLPPKLFSHNDQQSIWQASSPEGARSGWGGRIGDLMASGNGQSTFTCVSVSGNAIYLSGADSVQYQVSANGSIAINGIGQTLYGSAAAANALRSLISRTDSPGLFEQSVTQVVARSIDANQKMSAALSAAPPVSTAFPSTALGGQLRMVARMLSARAGLGAKRQVFFVGLGGFDLHDRLLIDHPALLGQVADALAAFHQATVELGVAANVTTFTASDFGRTITSNGDGSDHGWGSHHFVLGGAVRGQQYYGTIPVWANNGPDDVGQGRLLPTTGVDQLAATLAGWFGVQPGDMERIVPNIARYSVRDLGMFA